MPRLTKRLIDSLKPRDRDYVVWDSDVKGFGARVRPSGKITYVLKYRVGGGRSGTIRKPAIGTHGSITADQARAIARQWLAEVARGGDPSGQRQERRRGPTVASLCERYLREHAEPYKRPSSVIEDRRLIEKRVVPALGQKQVHAITRDDVSRLHGGLRSTPYEGNRVLALVSKMLNLAEQWGLRPDGSNPCRHVKKFREAKRERFLSIDELARLGEALARAERDNAEVSSAIAAIRLLLFTGCRLSEILTLRWNEVDLANARLRLTESKTGPKVIHLSAPALEVLASIPRHDDNAFVVAGRKPGTHLVNLRKSWYRIRKQAGLIDVRVNDIRHTYASAGAAAGLSLPMIGKMLGHTQAATTQRYAHLAADPVKQAVETVAANIAAAMRGDEIAEVVALSKARR